MESTQHVYTVRAFMCTCLILRMHALLPAAPPSPSNTAHTHAGSVPHLRDTCRIGATSTPHMQDRCHIYVNQTGGTQRTKESNIEHGESPAGGGVAESDGQRARTRTASYLGGGIAQAVLGGSTGAVQGQRSNEAVQLQTPTFTNK